MASPDISPTVNRAKRSKIAGSTPHHMRLRSAMRRPLQHVDQGPGPLREADDDFLRPGLGVLVFGFSRSRLARSIDRRLQAGRGFPHFRLGNHAPRRAFLADDVQQQLGRFGKHQDFSGFSRVELNNHGGFRTGWVVSLRGLRAQ